VEDRRGLADRRAMAVVTAYERARGATLTDVSPGRDRRLSHVIEQLGGTAPHVASADFISSLFDETRIIEVKGRGSSGPITVIERERDTFLAATVHSWLYVVWNTTQALEYRLWLLRHPARLPWVETRAAERPPGGARGARHEAAFDCQPADIERLGVEVDLTGLDLPPKD